MLESRIITDSRIASVDYLRGMMAISIMLYHYITWSGVEYSQFMNVFSIYGVSIFYILSGLSLALAYDKQAASLQNLRCYIIKRIFRIFPLFSIAVTATIILKYVQYIILNKEFNASIYEIILNYSLVFGFVDTSLYLPIGGWSIGNEMVFYALFPVIMFFVVKRMNFALYFSYLMALFVYVYFAFFMFGETATSLEKWYKYINPFNQLFLFYSGVMIALLFSGIRVSRLIGSFFIVAIFSIFIFYPVGGEREDLTEGVARLLLTFLSISLVFLIYRTKLSIHKTLGNRLLFLGKVSYSVYLLHPLVGLPMAFVFEYFGLGVPFSYLISIMVTLYISHLSYKYVEMPMINKGKLVANRVNI